MLGFGPLPMRVRPGETTGIDKSPTRDAVMVRAPGPMHGGLGSELAGDTIGNHKVHGGDDQAVYADAREDLDIWEARLGRSLTNGMFGENLTTAGVEGTHAVIGERWNVGAGGLVLEVSAPRMPCRTFQAFPDLNHCVKTFTAAAIPGAYLRVVSPGTVRAGDEISVDHRPDHDVTVEVAFRARTSESGLLPRLLVAGALPEAFKSHARRAVTGLSDPPVG